MWAYQLTAPSRLSRIEVEPLDFAALPAGRVVVRLLAGAICGSDLPHFRGRLNGAVDAHGCLGYPMHEIVGEVVASRDEKVAVGARVVGWAEGHRGLAEFAVAKASELRVLSSALSDVHASIIQPLATVLCATHRLIRLPGSRAAVIGQGPLGMLFSHVLKTAGARSVVGIDLVDRSDVASLFGVDECITDASERWARGLTDRDRPDIVVEAIGHGVGTLNDAIAALARNGEIFAFGVPDDDYYPVAFKQLFRKNADLHAGVTTERAYWLAAADQYLDENSVLAEAYVTDVFPIDNAQDAYTRAATPAKGRLKVALTVPS